MLKPETVERALREIQKGYAQYQHFFEQLKSRDWLLPLWKSGRFHDPPAPEAEGDLVRLPFWPESRYLARMTLLPESRETVLKIALSIPTTENARVHEDLADIALSLEPDQAAKLVPQACGWVQSPWKRLLPEKLGNLIAHLASGGQGKAALRLTRAALALRPDPRAAQRQAEDSLHSPEPQPWFAEYDYAQIIRKSIEPIVQATGLKAFRLFRDLLSEAIELSRKPTEKGTEDYIYISHPAIEYSGAPDRLMSLLLNAVRDSAQLAINADTTRFASAIEILGEKKWASFRRLELHLSRVFLEEGRTFAERVFQTPDILDHSSTRHEAVLLLKAAFPLLSIDAQHKLLLWMNNGPGVDYGRRWLEFTQQPVTIESIQRLANDWRRDHLAILEGQLPPSYESTLEHLIADQGAVRPLDQVRRTMAGAFGPRSPKTAEELTNMPVNEILDFLKSWTPNNTEDIFQPNAEGLGRSLTATVIQRPRDFTDAALTFRALDPTYVRCFLDGLTAALKADRVFDWPNVLDLAVWVTSQPREIPGRRGALFTNDPDWGWTRDSIISLITEGFQDKPGKLLPEHRIAVWNALRSLSEDAVLSPDSEKGDQFDPLFLAVNSTRGRAIDAVIQYAQWVREFTKAESEDTNWRSRTFADIPEVKQVLEERLDVAKEPTLTIRSIFGRRLQALAALDWNWLESHVPRIFPLENEASLWFLAAWESYVTSYYAHPAMLPALRHAYCRAVENIDKGSDPKRRQTDVQHALAQHLLMYFWLGKLDFEDADHLLDDFYRKTSDDVRGHAMWFVGTSVSQWGDEAPQEVYVRLRELAERRLESVAQAKTPEGLVKELAGFGWWFTSKKFPEDWSLRTLLAILRLTKKTQSEMNVVKMFVELCPRYPSECIACLHFMVEGDRDGWLLVGVESEAKQTIRHALDSNNPQAITAARRLVEDLIARGHFDFRSLIS